MTILLNLSTYCPLKICTGSISLWYLYVDADTANCCYIFWCNCYPRHWFCTFDYWCNPNYNAHTMEGVVAVNGCNVMIHIISNTLNGVSGFGQNQEYQFLVTKLLPIQTSSLLDKQHSFQVYWVCLSETLRQSDGTSGHQVCKELISTLSFSACIIAWPIAVILRSQFLSTNNSWSRSRRVSGRNSKFSLRGGYVSLGTLMTFISALINLAAVFTIHNFSLQFSFFLDT